MVKINQAQIHTNQPKNVTLIIMSQRCVLFKGLLFYCLSHTTHTHIVFTNKEAPRPELHVGINFKLTLNTVLTATTTTKKNASYTPSKREMTLFLLLHLIWGCLYRELKGEGARAERGRSYGSYVRSLRKVKSDRRRKEEKKKETKKMGVEGGDKNKQTATPLLIWCCATRTFFFLLWIQTGWDGRAYWWAHWTPGPWWPPSSSELSL